MVNTKLENNLNCLEKSNNDFGNNNNNLNNNELENNKNIITELENAEFIFNSFKKTNKFVKDSVAKMVDNHVDVHLNKDFSIIDYIPNLNIQLFPHQKTAVKACVDLENKRIINFIRSNITLEYNAGILSEPVGSGKTLIILSTIIFNNVPRVLPDITGVFSNKDNTAYVKRKFKKIIKCNLIFVGSSVLKQWETAITTYTKLKYFVVKSVLELRKLFKLMENNEINNYDLILIKNGKITVDIKLPFDVELEPKNKSQVKYIYNLIANLRNYCWIRVVVDDFDTIGLPSDASIIPGIFTWYISSTRKKMVLRKEKDIIGNASDFLSNYNYGCSNIVYNHVLYSKLNVRNDVEFIKATTQIPNPKFHVAVFKNPNNKMISLISTIGGDEISRITEMLNADALNEAAEALNIKTTSVKDIFKNLLGNKYEEYRKASILLDFIEYQIDKKESREPMPKEGEYDKDDPTYKYGKKDLLDLRDIEYKFPGINSLLKETKEEYEKIKKDSNSAIERVKKNLKTGECPVCKLNLEGCDKLAIANCCNIVYCGGCSFKAQNLTNRSSKLEGRCTNCRSPFKANDFIFISDVGDKIKIDDIIEEKYEDDEEVIEKGLSALTVKKDRTKYSSVIDIINGESLPEDKRVDLYIPNMMKGTKYLPEGEIRKVLIFANFEETLDNIMKELDESDIMYWRLQGGISEIAETSKQFTLCKKTCALVINSTKHCSGLNLQTATDLVFTHRMIDQAVESQVAGRGHRLGRTNPLNIWYLTYDNEAKELYDLHNVRELTKEDIEYEKSMTEGNIKTTLDDVTDNDSLCDFNKPKSVDKKRRIKDEDDEKDDNNDNSNNNSNDNDNNDNDNYNEDNDNRNDNDYDDNYNDNDYNDDEDIDDIIDDTD